jgi:ribosomal protein RSM22 (predicted rRNA methylase)
LVISSFALSELPNDTNRKATIDALWNQTNDILVLIDRGTPVGFDIISQARSQILDSCRKNGDSVYIVAPVSFH